MTVSVYSLMPLILIGLVILAVVVLLVVRLRQSTSVVGDEAAKTDALDEDASPAVRNQALIDAAPAVAQAEITPTSAEPASASAPAPAPAPAETVPVTAAGANDLSQIKGLGPKLVTLLGDHEITSLAQVAAWSESDIETIDAKLGRFSGRITRDQWVEQAKLLISGDESAYAAKFGNAK